MYLGSSRQPGMKTLTLLALTIVSPLAAADGPPKEIQNMDCLIGSWKGGGSIVIGKDKAKLDASWSCKKTGADFGVLCNLRVTGIPGIAVYEETDLFGYEPHSKTYHWFAVTNAGETHDHVAPFTDKNKIRFTYAGTQEGKPFKEVVDWEFSGAAKPGDKPTQVSVRGETFASNASTSVIELKLKKQ
jgi:hypothetical protein